MRKLTDIITIAILVIVIAAGVIFFTTGGRREPSGEAEAAETAEPALPSPSPTPSPTPEPTPTPEPEPEYFVLSFVGDCTLASSQHLKGSAAAFETVVGTDYAFPFAKTADYFKNDYLSVANLESTFTTSNASNGATFTFKSDPVYAKVFSEGGIDLAVLGNNHGSDYGAVGIADTKAALEAAGVSYAAEDDWYIYQKDDGIKIGVYSKLYPVVQDVERGVAALKEAGAELIVCALHWGLEGKYGVTLDQQTVGHAAIDAGADIVYGSHPHVLQRTEEYGGGYIYYSLGNWSFGGHTAPRDRDTAIIQTTVMRDKNGISLVKTDYIPCELSSKAGANNYQPQPYEEGSEGYTRAMSKLDGSFTGPDLTIDYSAFHKNDGADSAGSADGQGSAEAAPPAGSAVVPDAPAEAG